MLGQRSLRWETEQGQGWVSKRRWLRQQGSEWGKNTRELPKSPLPLGRVGQTPVWLKTEEIPACGDNT